MEPSPEGGLSGEVLAVVAETWKRQKRSLTARFGGSSMLPTLDPGVLLGFDCGSRVEVGDIAVLLHRGQVVVHRVVARHEPLRLVLTRGDGTWVPDPPMAEDQVVARVTRVHRGSRWVDPPTGPSSSWRRLVVGICVRSLGLGEPWTRRLIGLLWLSRYGLQRTPKALVGKLRARSTTARD